MERQPWLIAIAAAVALSVIGLAVALLLPGDETVETLGATASPTAEPTPSPPTPTPTDDAATAEPTTAPTEQPTQAPPASPTAPPQATPARTAPPTVAATDVDCGADPSFCSNVTGRMFVDDDRLESSGQTPHTTDYSRTPRTTMDWEIQTTGGAPAGTGDPVEMLVVTVVIENNTVNRTFVFPGREIVLDINRDGADHDDLATQGDPFEMPPGGRLEANYEVPISSDGDYRWRAKTWFYES